METTERLGLPLLVPGQGQKDVTHNEALVQLDALVQPVAESRMLTIPPGAPQSGQSWLVAAGATGNWAGMEGSLATWTAGGWRFARLPAGATVWVRDDGRTVRRVAAGWEPITWTGLSAAAPAGPAGGTVVDVEARAAIGTLVAKLVGLRLLEPG